MRPRPPAAQRGRGAALCAQPRGRGGRAPGCLRRPCSPRRLPRGELPQHTPSQTSYQGLEATIVFYFLKMSAAAMPPPKSSDIPTQLRSGSPLCPLIEVLSTVVAPVRVSLSIPECVSVQRRRAWCLGALSPGRRVPGFAACIMHKSATPPCSSSFVLFPLSYIWRIGATGEF